MTVPMTAAEFRITRDRLGLTLAWLAKRLNVQERTVARWDAGHIRIPTNVQEELAQIEEDSTEYVDYLAERVTGRLETFRTDGDFQSMHPDEEYPASWHRAIAGRVQERVPGLRVDYWPQEPRKMP